MELEIQGRAAISDPNGVTINEALQTLDGSRTSFAILSGDSKSFLKAVGGGGSSFTLEYKDGHTGRHYHLPKQESLEVVNATFQDYARQGENWEAASHVGIA